MASYTQDTARSLTFHFDHVLTVAQINQLVGVSQGISEIQELRDQVQDAGRELLENEDQDDDDAARQLLFRDSHGPIGGVS